MENHLVHSHGACLHHPLRLRDSPQGLFLVMSFHDCLHVQDPWSDMWTFTVTMTDHESRPTFSQWTGPAEVRPRRAPIPAES